MTVPFLWTKANGGPGAASLVSRYQPIGWDDRREGSRRGAKTEIGEPRRPAGFDKAYVDNEVAYHKTVNAALKDTLIPDAQNPELKSLLQSGLTLFQAHLEHAETLAKQLQ
jgi:hypothetical protein